MSGLQVTALAIPDVLRIAPQLHTDARGAFFEAWRADRYEAAGIRGPFVQDNVSRSGPGVLRGLHLQWPQHAQGKLVSVLHGRVWDVAVDVRMDSPTFTQWVGCELSDTNQHQLWIPPGFAHGFVVLSDTATVVYKVTAPYSPVDEIAIRWDDPTLNIAWPVRTPTISARDAAAPLLADIARERLPRVTPR